MAIGVTRCRWLRFGLLVLLTLGLLLGLGARPAPADAEVDRLVAEAKTYLEAQTGHRFTKPIIATREPYYQGLYIRDDGYHLATSRAAARDPDHPGRWIDLNILEGRAGRELPEAWEACLVVFSDTWSGQNATAQRSTVAHELFHCYQREKWGSSYRAPLWVLEGSAVWAGETYTGGSSRSETTWPRYLQWTARLNERSYDALGVFAHMAHSGEANVWQLIDRAFTPPLPPPAAEAQWTDRFLGLMANRNEFLQTWAMGLERNPSQREWNTSGPGITPERREVQPLPIGEGRQIQRTVQRLYQITLPERQVIAIDVVNGGHGGLRWGNTTTRISDSFNRRYCLGDTCRCDDGSQPPGVTSVNASRGIIALTGYPDTAQVWVDPIENPCEPEEDPVEPADPEVDGPSTPWPGGDRGRGTSYGDPHIITYDGYRYSFQTLGEFWLTRSPNGPFQVQARQGQIPGRPLSMNTAVAMQVGGHRLGIYAQDPPDGQSPLWLDGRPLTLNEPAMALPGGGQLLRQGQRYQVNWPTGETVQVSQTTLGGAAFLTVMVEVPRSGTQYQGLLGNFNGSPGDDLQIRGGGVVPTQDVYAPVTRLVRGLIPSPVPLNRVQTAFFQQLYRQFGDSWRITAAESLFDYGSGQSTDTFTRRDFPSQFPSLVGVAPAQIQQATRLCQEAGVNEWMMEGCVFDVAATGQPGFVQGAVDAIASTLVNQVQNRVEQEIRRQIPLPFPLPRLPF